MTITYQKLVPQWNGTSPTTSASYTPIAGGDTILFFCRTGGGANAGLAITGAASALQANIPSGNTSAILDILSCSSGAQTFTLSDTISNSDACFQGIEYSGVGTITNASGVSVATPGTGSNAISGSAISVPTGSILLAFCGDVTFPGSDTITTSGTQRLSGGTNPYWCCIGEYAGAGSSITPQFTATAGATSTYIVLQAILNPPAVVYTPYSSTQFFVTDTIVQM